MNYLFIAEKPSLMRDVEACYRNHKSEIESKIGQIDFVALSGHICANYQPNDYPDWQGAKWQDVDYPMVPTRWGIKAIEDDYKKKTIAKVKSMVGNYDGIIVGTDSDVEGYGIYFLLENYLGITKMPALRFMEHSLTDSEILKSLFSMTDYHTDPRHVRYTQSYLVRSRADWLFGMNATRMMSVKAQEIFAIGRVKAPTVKLVYDNSMAIDNFKPKKYYLLAANYGSFVAHATEDGKNPNQYETQDKIPTVTLDGIVKDVKTERVTTHSPKLYDLAAIQIEAGSSLKLTPDQTLEVIQSLYETHKLISYPRTQCRFVSYEKAKEFFQIMKNMSVFPELAEIAAKVTDDDIKRVLGDKQVVNDAEVQKESHDALLPTLNRPDLGKLSENERKVCMMIYKRLLAQFLPKLEEDKTQVLVEHKVVPSNEPMLFISKGRTIINQGWRVLYGSLKDNIIPPLKEGDSLHAEEITSEEKETKPPKRLSEATLIDAMEHIAQQIEDKELKKSLADSKGIGTPATRATIIKDIISRGYVESKKGKLFITSTGIKYINSIKDLDIVSPVFAAIMDTDIKKVQRGEESFNTVYDRVLEDLNKMCKQIDGLKVQAAETNIKCPHCGGQILIRRYSYECSNGDVKIRRNPGGVPLTEAKVAKLLAGETLPEHKYKNKEGKEFTAKLKVEKSTNGIYQDTYVFDDAYANVSMEKINEVCPKCGKPMTNDKKVYSCECGFKIWKIIGQTEITPGMLHELLEKGVTKKYSFTSKAGKPFEAMLKLTENGAEYAFDDVTDTKEARECPICTQQSLKVGEKGAFCSCGVKIYRTIVGKTLTDEEIMTLLNKGKLENVSGFKSKKGKEFSATLELKDKKAELKFE